MRSKMVLGALRDGPQPGDDTCCSCVWGVPLCVGSHGFCHWGCGSNDCGRCWRFIGLHCIRWGVAIRVTKKKKKNYNDITCIMFTLCCRTGYKRLRRIDFPSSQHVCWYHGAFVRRSARNGRGNGCREFCRVLLQQQGCFARDGGGVVVNEVICGANPAAPQSAPYSRRRLKLGVA